MIDQATTAGGLRGLPQMMRFMSNCPDPQSTVDALLHGPFAHLNAIACHIYRYEEPNRLVLYAGRGLEETVMARCQTAPLELRTPLSDAFFSLEIELLSFGEMLEQYEAIRIADEPLWREYIEHHGNQMLLCAPIVMNGVAVGGYSVFLPEDYALTSIDFSVFSGIGALLGLWMTHGSQAPALHRMNFQFVDERSVELTERQLCILKFIEEGRSVGWITRTLGYSPSTIRQELQRVMKNLRVTDRAAAVSKARELGLLRDELLQRA
ncbi:MAG: LuxR C-terminal-related transcriptional regulator [Actinomycetota bacterium]|nr:LuxR C-terminal-related transcriptional regulator [Actinomycetota bacterium]